MIRSLLNYTFHIPLILASLKYCAPGEASSTVSMLEARNMDVVGISRSLDAISTNFLPGSCESHDA